MGETGSANTVGQVPRLDHESYLEARKSWEAASTDQTKFLDQSNLTLAGGALGLSLTFLHSFSTPPKFVDALFVGGALLLAAIVLTLASVHTSQHAIRRYIEDLDTAALGQFAPKTLGFLEGKYVNRAARVTFWLNVGSSISLVAGIAFLAYFAYKNLELL